MAERIPNSPPSPNKVVPPGAPALPHATSVIESGLERDARLAREAAAAEAAVRAADPRPLLPAPASVIDVVADRPPTLVPEADAPQGATVPKVRAWRPTRIAAPAAVRVEPEPSPPVSTAGTLDHIAPPPEPEPSHGSAPPAPAEPSPAPEDPGPLVGAKTVGPTTKVVISSLRAATEADKAWALPERVGTTVPAVHVEGLGWIRFSSVIGVMVESTEVDLRSGERIVYVSVVFSPDPGHGQMRAKLRSGNKLLEGQLLDAITAAFSVSLPPLGKVLRFVAGSPTMTDTEVKLAGYTARKVDANGKKRAPVRAEFSMKEVSRRQDEVRALYDGMQLNYSPFRTSLVLFWWWCIGFLAPSRRARLAAYKMGERFSQLEAGGGRQPEPPVSRVREAAALVNAANIAKNVAASHSSLVWMAPDLRAALVEKGVQVHEIAGTRLGTMIDDGGEIR